MLTNVYLKTYKYKVTLDKTMKLRQKVKTQKKLLSSYMMFLANAYYDPLGFKIQTKIWGNIWLEIS